MNSSVAYSIPCCCGKCIKEEDGDSNHREGWRLRSRRRLAIQIKEEVGDLNQGGGWRLRSRRRLETWIKEEVEDMDQDGGWRPGSRWRLETWIKVEVGDLDQGGGWRPGSRRKLETRTREHKDTCKNGEHGKSTIADLVWNHHHPILWEGRPQ